MTDEIRLTDEAEDAMILKDAASILMTGETGRSGRAVLLASLLEQLHVPYVLVYAKSGLWLAVKSDRQFAPPKGSDFEWSSSTWALLDLSRPGFKIGSAPRVSTPTDSFFFVQNVSGDGALVDKHAGTVEFKTR